MAEGKRPRAIPAPSHRAYYSGIELVEAEDSNRPLIVGERTNVIGSRLFKNMVAEEKWEEATEIARWQVKNGAHIIDVCLQSTDRDEIADIPPFYEKLIRKIKAPLMIDTTDPEAVELALTYCQGKSIINSINLEDGEEKFERVCPIARRYGAALVVGSIDEDKLQAQAFTRERKLAVAERSYRLLTEKYGIAPEDIIIDPLVFPCATGDVNYIGAAVETIEGIRLVKEKLPLREDRAGHLEHLLRAAGRGARSGELGLPVLLHQGRARPGHRQRREAGALRLDSRRRSAAWRRTCCSIRRRWMPTTNRCAPRPRTGAQQSAEQKAAINQWHIAAVTEHFRKTGKRVKAARRGPAARPAAGQLHHRRHQGRPDRRPRPQARRRRRAARHHQRAADGRHVRSGPPVQQQRADCGRSAAIGRSHEGRGELPGTVHGEGRHARRAAR